MAPILARRAIVWICLLIVAVALFAGTPAFACPTCKDGIAQSDAQQNLARGYFWSIILMMSLPFLMLGSFSAYMYVEIRKARARAAREAAGSKPAPSPSYHWPAQSASAFSESR